jgi:hypothetical protein
MHTTTMVARFPTESFGKSGMWLSVYTEVILIRVTRYSGTWYRLMRDGGVGAGMEYAQIFPEDGVVESV